MDFKFFNRLVLDDFYMEDEVGDTLAYSKKIILNLKKFSTAERMLDIQKISFKDCVVRLATDSNNVLNFNLITDKLKPKDSTRVKMSINIDGIDVNNGVFIFDAYHKKPGESGINFTDLRLEDVNLEINDLGKQRNDTLSFTISRLDFREKSGFTVKRFISGIEIHRKFIVFQNLEMTTPVSRIKAAALGFNYNSFKDFKDFISNVSIDFILSPSEVGTNDLAYFSPVFRNINENLLFTGRIYGKINDLKGKEVQLLYGENTGLIGNFNLIGLPKIRETYIYLDVRNFTVGLEEVASISWPGSIGKIVVPENLRQLGVISFHGNFTGFIDDFVTYGNFHTDLGNFSSDLSIKPDTANTLQFNGRLQTRDFHIGDLLKKREALGDISMNIQIAGYSKAWKTFTGSLEGMIEHIELNKYDYKNIRIDGNYRTNSFDGSIFIEDPNVKLNFLGLVDFSGKVPEFDFTANIFRANLHALNLYDRDSTLSMKMLVTANFAGNTIDNLQGTIKVLNSTFYSHGKELTLYNASLSALNNNGNSSLSLRTDYLDADLRGAYELNHLVPAFRYILAHYLPSFQPQTVPGEMLTTNQFEYSVDLKAADPLLSFIFPGMELSEGCHIEGLFHPLENNLTFRFEGDLVGYKSFQASNFSVVSIPVDQNYTLHVRANRLNLSTGMTMRDFLLDSRAMNDSVTLRLLWNDKKKEANRGDINSTFAFQLPAGHHRPVTQISVYPSEIVVRDSTWKIHPATITIDTTSILIDHLLINNQEQTVSASGGLSNNITDTLKLNFHQLDLSWINELTRSRKMKVNGILHGSAELTGIYDQPVFFSNLTIDGFSFNDQLIGNTYLLDQWQNKSKSIHVSLTSNRDGQQPIAMDGDYYPADEEYNFDITVDKLGIAVMEPFLSKVFSDMEGTASGNLKLDGDMEEPVLNGRLNFQKSSLVINYLKTKYTFSESMEFKDNSMYFNKVKVYDVNSNTAILNGNIQNEGFTQYTLDLSVDAKNFNFLNTGEGDNSIFYGVAYGTGIVKLTGPPSQMKIIASARTDKNTRLFIPLSSDESVSELDYIRFINVPADTVQTFTVKDYQVNTAGMQMDFDLEITPDAEGEIIFDTKTGDILRGRGSGNLKMEINTLGNFRMMGEYEIEEGTYMFTLQNIQIKKFDVVEGGKIIWNGDPLDATIDIQAAYRTRASLYDLAMDENYSRRIPVNCMINLSGRLMSPDIQFSIDLPTADEETRNYLSNFTNTQQKLINQFLSLLVLDNFLPDQNLVSSTPAESKTGGMGMANVGATTSKILSNQLANWISDIDEDFDIGFNYIPGEGISNNQLEVALSTQLLNDRVSLNGYVDVGGTQAKTQASKIQGEFDMEVKLNKSGKLRLKAFNRANDKLIYELAPYTQGIGLFYREEFNRFDKLLQQYWDKLFGKKVNQHSTE
jgi:hypothetical protein